MSSTLVLFTTVLFFLVNTDRLGEVKRTVVQIKKINHVNNGYRADDINNLDFLEQASTT